MSRAPSAAPNIMRNVANSTMQVVCAALIAGASPLAAQGEGQPRETVQRRSALAHALRDSVKRILAAAVSDHAFPGAYAVVGDSRGVLAEAGGSLAGRQYGL